jgi:hypothetical protein
MQIVDEEYAVYNLFHHTDAFNVEYPQLTIADKLQCLENFDRIDPLFGKTGVSGVMLAKCTCTDSYRSMCCVESIVFSMLFSPELVVPNTDQLKEKTKAKVTPFNAADLRKKENSERQGCISGTTNVGPQHSEIQIYDA